ncbi:MAG TPA: hypothetical protein GX736_01890 [Mogibacterium sp.]|nr:hypothetical protein [Mogibacterium sp.]
MRNYIRKLKNNNSDVLVGLDIFMGEDMDEQIEEIFSSDIYKPYSAEEVFLALSQSGFLYITMFGFLNRLYEEVLKK